MVIDPSPGRFTDTRNQMGCRRIVVARLALWTGRRHDMHRYRGAYRLEFVTYRDLLEAAVGQVAFHHSPQPPRVRDMTAQCRKAVTSARSVQAPHARTSRTDHHESAARR